MKRFSVDADRPKSLIAINNCQRTAFVPSVAWRSSITFFFSSYPGFVLIFVFKTVWLYHNDLQFATFNDGQARNERTCRSFPSPMPPINWFKHFVVGPLGRSADSAEFSREVFSIPTRKIRLTPSEKVLQLLIAKACLAYQFGN